MDEIRNGVTTDQCNPRRLSKNLDAFLNENNLTELTKRKLVIAWLICSSENGCKITRFDAEMIGDHCLNTSISEIGRLEGIKVSRNDTKRPTRFGKPTDCKEYWLEPDQINKAKTILGVE